MKIFWSFCVLKNKSKLNTFSNGQTLASMLTCIYEMRIYLLQRTSAKRYPFDAKWIAL